MFAAKPYKVAQDVGALVIRDGSGAECLDGSPGGCVLENYGLSEPELEAIAGFMNRVSGHPGRLIVRAMTLPDYEAFARPVGAAIVAHDHDRNLVMVVGADRLADPKPGVVVDSRLLDGLLATVPFNEVKT